MRDRFSLAVVGAGASGLAAAISAARRGASAVLLERLPRAGRKLLATGGGRCNLLNEALSASAFTSTDPSLVGSVLGRFGPAEIRSLFEGLGLRLQADVSGRVYPVTNQAASVLRVLELETARLKVTIKTGFEVDGIASEAGRFIVRARDGREVEASAVVLAGGGLSYPALGSNGSCLELAAAFGHRVVAPVPSAVPLCVKDRMCHLLQGQRMRVRVEGQIDGRPAGSAEGEFLFTRYGISGTAVLDVSEGLSVALNREGRRDVAVVVDFLPFMTAEEASGEFLRRSAAGWAPGELVTGLLPEKFARVLARGIPAPGRPPVDNKDAQGTRGLAAALKAWKFPVQGTRGWNEAEFTAGGVDASEVRIGTLESRLRPGLYLAGEVLDVQGGRGGFNLGWAWASGFVAGLGG
ncbi:MAG TPA: aminoacetone oxidase family FAD-binding enzyme [Candidatus Aminicenantes bacterium]|nr:aminoacetone oxidase family FAD-binding enzyme [Candidatus Aminicenantes bacterium]HDT14216.1 aminoacetone oxidase family FAD-binding enzyme [Candidatus Aminicenantes bacterium]